MRPLARTAAVAALLAACGDADRLTEPVPDQVPALSLGVFGFNVLDIPGAVIVSAVNDLGQAVGSRFVQGQAGSNAWFYQSGSVFDLPVPAGTFSYVSTDVNASGTAVGSIGLEAVAWVQGTPVILETGFDPADHSSNALAVNNLGRIVGTDFDNQNGGAALLFWDDASDQTPAMVPPGAGFGTPAALNDAGMMVGGGRDAGVTSAVVWPSPSTPHQILKGFDGAPCSTDDPKDTPFASSVNQTGAIAGTCRTSSGLMHPAFWSDLNAVAVDLEPTSTENGFAGTVNDLGQIGGTLGGRPALWMREGTGFRRFDLGMAAGAASGSVTDLNNNGIAAGGSGGAAFWDVPRLAQLDIVPGDALNRVKLDRRGVVRVAVLGSRWLQVQGIDPQTLTLGNDDGQETPVARKKKVTPIVSLTDVNRDGRTDLVADFEELALVANGELALGQATLVLLGRFRDGTNLRGSGVVQANR
jgi:hypothetical protein